jgi:hypothetical protein
LKESSINLKHDLDQTKQKLSSETNQLVIDLNFKISELENGLLETRKNQDIEIDRRTKESESEKSQLTIDFNVNQCLKF